MKLLTIGGNTKIKKSDNAGEYLTAILHLAPAKLSGKEFCPGRSKGCTEACLNTAGRGVMGPVKKARLEKSRLFIENKAGFIALLELELKAFIKKCEKLKVKPAVRLNGTSDLPWERMGIMEKFPEIQFYDYTAVPIRFDRTWKKPDNYHLTFSLKEDNDDKAKIVLANGGNVAVVFKDKLPETYLGFKVIDGDKTDLRFKDPKNVIVGLTAKGKAKKDTSGFVRT